MDPQSLRLLTLEQVIEMLNLQPEQVEHLVSTGQLPDLRIEGNRLFDSRDLECLIHIYKQVRARSRNGQS